MQATYHNTNLLTGDDLKKAVANALKQEDAIFTIYLNTRKRWTAWDVHGMMTRAGHRLPITSVRRGITNLMNRGELIKTSDRKQGEYGSPECFYHLDYSKYQIKIEQPELF